MTFRVTLFLALISLARVHAFEIYSTEPGDGAQDVNPESAIQFFVDEQFDAKTIKRDTVQLLDAEGKALDVVLTPDLGGAVTVSPAKPLQPNAKYTLKVSSKLKSASGEALKPFTGTFWTGTKRVLALENEPAFAKTRIDSGEGYVSCSIGPDGNLYVTTWTGDIVRLLLDEKTGGLKSRETVFSKNGSRILGLCLDPQSTADTISLWITHDDNGGESSSPGKFTSGVSRLRFDEKGKLKDETLFITGLPNGAQPLTSCAFGPDGKLYLAQGSTTHLGGGTPPLAESPLSAAVLVADVRAADFGGGKLPVNCDPTAPNSYDPSRADAPVKAFATGVREAFDFCWHSNGQLYAALNMNDTIAAAPSRDGLPTLRNIQPDEPLIRVMAGKHYGHPNPSINKYVLMGGNPTAERDPWEIYKYPVGTQPDAGFDPALLIYNLAPLGGPSANGCCEYTAAGVLKGRLLICFYTTTRTIHSFTLSPDGTKVTGNAPLLGEDGTPLKFGAPLDIAQHPSGRLYVTDFQDKRRGDSGTTGGVWMLDPLVKSTKVPK